MLCSGFWGLSAPHPSRIPFVPACSIAYTKPVHIRDRWCILQVLVIFWDFPNQFLWIPWIIGESWIPLIRVAHRSSPLPQIQVLPTTPNPQHLTSISPIRPASSPARLTGSWKGGAFDFTG